MNSSNPHVRFTTCTKAGNTLQVFYNRDLDLLVVDLIHKTGEGGSEIVRMTLDEAHLLEHVETA